MRSYLEMTETTDRQIREKGEELANLLKNEKPYILFLDELISKTKYGQLTVTLRYHEGFVTDIVVITNQRKKFEMKKPVDKHV